MAIAAKTIESHGEWLSEQAIAKRLGMDRHTVSSRLEDLGYEPDPERSNARLKLHFFDKQMEFAIRAAKDEAATMKIRGLRADAQLKELKLARERGEMVAAAEMIEIVQKLVSNIYQEVTVRQGKRIDAKLAKAKNVLAVKKIRKADTDRIMKNLRENFERFLGAENEPQSTQRTPR